MTRLAGGRATEEGGAAECPGCVALRLFGCVAAATLIR